MNKSIIITLSILAIIIAVILFTFSKPSVSSKEIDEFAKCLTKEGAVMYGAFWCPHCARTKKRFGSSFRYIKYVECDPRGDNEQSELCISKKIDAYDTWEFADGSRLLGEPSFAAMSSKTSCPLPSKTAE